MRFGKIVIENFFRIKLLQIDLTQHGINLIEGKNLDTGRSNESGKSSIFEALCWVLFGSYASGGARAGDEIVNPVVGGNCRVEVEIITEDDVYSIVRTRLMDPGRQSQLFVTATKSEGQIFDLRQKDISASTRVVEDILGMDYETFVRAYYFPQEGVIPFGRMTDKSLKEFFVEKLLNISWVQNCHEDVNSEYRISKTDVELIKVKLKGLYENLDDINARSNELSEKMDKWHSDWEGRRFKLVWEKDDLERRFVVAKKNLSKKKDELLEIQKKIDSIIVEDLSKDLADINKEIGRTEAGIGSIVAKIKGICQSSDNLTEVLEKVRDMVGEECPTCGNKITSKSVPIMQSQYITELGRNDSNKSQLESNLNLMDNTLTNLRNKQLELENKQKENNELRKEKAELENKLISTEEMKEVESIDGILALKKIELDALEREQCPFLGLHNKEIERSNECMEKIKQLEKDMELLESRIKDMEFWVKGFSPGGIQSFLLESVIGTINKRISEYMAYLSDNRIRAYFTATKLLKSGDLREKFGLEIENIDGGNTYASLSGGAKKRVDIACALAIGDFKRSLSTKSLDFIVFDEVSVGVDEYWTDRLITMIKEKFSSYSTFFITHQPINQSYFDKVITIKKKDGETLLEE